MVQGLRTLCLPAGLLGDCAQLAEELFENTQEGCFVSNTVTATVDLAPQFKTKDGGSSN